MTSISKSEQRIQLRNALSPAMFFLSLGYLAIIAALLVLWIDVPRVFDLSEFDIADVADDMQVVESMVDEQTEILFQSKAAMLSFGLMWALICLWALFLLEQLAYLLLADNWQQYRRHHPYGWLICLVPPFRLCARHREADDVIWFPVLGWQKPTFEFRFELERHTSSLMIGIALLILPVLGLQMIYGPQLAQHPVLRILLHFGTGLIWFAFATEFLVMVSITDKKLKYCKKHWLDLVIILLPLISFLRSWKLLRATKLVKFSKLQQLSKIVRVYRLRGVSMRALRALLVLDVLQRILRTKPERRLEKLQEQYAEKEAELAILRQEIEKLQQLQSEPSKQSVVATEQKLAPASPTK